MYKTKSRNMMRAAEKPPTKKEKKGKLNKVNHISATGSFCESAHMKSGKNKKGKMLKGCQLDPAPLDKDYQNGPVRRVSVEEYLRTKKD